MVNLLKNFYLLNMDKLNEIKNGFLDIVKAELSSFGFDTNEIMLDSKNLIEIKSHLLDMSLLRESCELSHKTMTFKGYSLDDGRIVIYPTEKFMEEYRTSDTLYEEIEIINKKIEHAFNDLYSEFLKAIRELNDEKTLKERIVTDMVKNLQITDSLKDIESWKARIIVGNSLGRDSVGIGEMDSVGYVHIGINTGTIVPISRGDEHHRGYDLVFDYIEKGVIPDDLYYPLFHNGDYVDGYDPVALEAMKTWRRLGGPNFIIKNKSQRDSKPFQVMVDDYIKMEGKISFEKGTLLPVGKEFIDYLSKISKMTTDFRKNLKGEKHIYQAVYKFLSFYKTKMVRFETKDYKEFLNLVMEAEATGDIVGLQKLEEVLFGFNGIKNKIHQSIRKALDPDSFSFQREEMEAIFGDLELANHLMGSI